MAKVRRTTAAEHLDADLIERGGRWRRGNLSENIVAGGVEICHSIALK
jgi:hypothetical protein